jgi:hypothetical protein
MIYQPLVEPFFADFHPDRDWGKLTRFDLLEFSELLAYYKDPSEGINACLTGLKEKD